MQMFVDYPLIVILLVLVEKIKLTVTPFAV
jgi:hypothetical protein